MNPCFYLASTHSPTEPLLGALLESAGVKGIVDQEADWIFQQDVPASPTSLARTFAKEILRIRIFHFAGHAFEQQLQFNDDLDLAATCLVYPEGMAGILTSFQSPQLVFLNGCSTQKQVQHFLDKGVPAVIATNKPLNDEYGYTFALQFYDTFFNSEKGLEDAFKYAIERLKQLKGNFSAAWLNEKLAAAADRGALVLDRDPAKPVYELFTKDPAFRVKKLSEWAQLAVDSGQSAGGSGQPPNGSKTKRRFDPEVHPLLCNRSLEVRKLEKALETQMLKPPPKRPVIFFINDLKSAAPHKLFQRFELHDVERFREKQRLPQDWLEWHLKIELPASDQWDDAGKCLSRLKEIYNLLHENAPTDDLGGKTNRLLAVHHNLNSLLIRPKPGVNLTGLFEVYCKEFSQYLEEEFAGRVAAVLFVVDYFDKPEGHTYRDFFKELATRHPHVVNLTEMSGISLEDVNDWLHVVFDGDPPEALDPEAIFPKESEEIPMAQALEILKTSLEKYSA